MPKLSDTALVVLTDAARRDDRVAELPPKLPTAARNAVARSLLKQGLLEQADGGTLHITASGLRVLNLEPSTDTTTVTAAHSGPQDSLAAVQVIRTRIEDTALYGPQNAAVGKSPMNLRNTAQAVLIAWDNRETQPDHMAVAIDQLRTLMTAKPHRIPRDPAAPRKPREGTKQQAVLALLRRNEGANIAQIVAATAWAQHTVRDFLANLKRKGITVEVLERVRQVGAGGIGAKGSFSIYRIADAG